MKSQGLAWLPLLIVVATVALAGIVGYAVVTEFNEDESGDVNTTANVVTNTTTETRTYSDSELGYSFAYPSELAAKTFTIEETKYVFLLDRADVAKVTAASQANALARVVGIQSLRDQNIVATPGKVINAYGVPYYLVTALAEEGDPSDWVLTFDIDSYQLRYSFHAADGALANSIANSLKVKGANNKNTSNTNTDGVVCTMDAKQCPDGSYVGRVGPDCQFEACPGGNANAAVNTNSTTNTNTSTVPANWKTYTNTTYHLSVRYPSDWQAVEDSSLSPFHISLSRTNGTSQGGITILARYPNSTSGVGGNENAVSTTKKVTIGNKSATEYSWTDKRNGQPISLALIFDELPRDWPDDNPTLEPSNTERYIAVGPAIDGSYDLVRQILSTFQFTD